MDLVLVFTPNSSELKSLAACLDGCLMACQTSFSQGTQPQVASFPGPRNEAKPQVECHMRNVSFDCYRAIG